MAFKKMFLAAMAAAAIAGGVGVVVLAPQDETASFGVERVTLPPLTLNQATLTIAGPDGEKTFDGGQLEALGAHRVTTRTPWRETPATFDGVLLTDVLAASGLSDAKAIRVFAENDYAVDIARSVWSDRPALIATRVDGAPHDRRERGPLQFVFPMDADAATAESDFESNWVWMAARIEPID